MHLHEYSEILYCKSGEGVILINGRKIALRAECFVWIPPNYIHQLDFSSAEVVCAVFSNDFIPLYFSVVGEKRLIPSAISALDLTSHIEGLPSLKKEDQLLVSGKLNIIAQRVIERSDFEESLLTDGVLFQKVVTYISNHYVEEIKLSSLAKLFGYNEKYLSHLFRLHTKSSFTEHLRSLRIQNAISLFDIGLDSIKNVAYLSGFNDPLYFSNVFKKEIGVSPTEYKSNKKR
jgi:AraC-like DNA-binding protein